MRWQDAALGGACLVAVVFEVVFQQEIVRPLPALLAGVALGCLLPWRNRRPQLACTVAFSGLTVLDIVTLAASERAPEFHSAAFVLFFPYAVFRWGAGREILISSAVMSASWFVSIWADSWSAGDAVGGAAVLSVSAVAGAAVRAGAATRRRELDTARMRERERLARELHDSVAHHVSAIAVQAQAGRAVAETAPGAVTNTLAAIETAASQALAEMRATVRALRGGNGDDLATLPGVADLPQLAAAGGKGSAAVVVHLHGDLGNLSVPVDLAVYRIAQEAVTNAVRHAHGATRVEVHLHGDHRRVRLTVTDDGQPTRTTSPRSRRGYGLEGMRERVAMLSGTISVGPRRQRGWRVDVELPRGSSAS